MKTLTDAQFEGLKYAAEIGIQSLREELEDIERGSMEGPYGSLLTTWADELRVQIREAREGLARLTEFEVD